MESTSYLRAALVAGPQLPPSQKRLAGAPLQLLEYLYYGAVFYGYMGEVLGLSIGMLGAGMISVLAVVCSLRLGRRAFSSVALGFPILFTVSFTIVQTIVHGESLMDPSVRPIVVWMLTVIILSALCSRPGFIPRFAAAQFVIGLTALPLLNLSERAGVDAAAGVLRNPNGLAAFFGFTAVAFTVRGLETRRGLAQWLHMAVALFSLLIVGLTVSRSPLGGYGVAVVIAFRKQLRRSFFPILVLVALGGGAFAAGMFDDVILSYSDRGMEDTGRFSLWPNALHGFLDSPIAGVGVSRVGVEMPGRHELVTPHNEFLFVGLSSGIIPLLLFAGYRFTGLLGALKTSAKSPAYAYLLPLWIYAFFLDQFGSQGFLEPWNTFCVCICLVQLIPGRPGRRLQHTSSVALNPTQARVPVVARPL